MVMGNVQTSGNLDIDRRRGGGGHQRIDIHVLEEFRKI
jgi:hypothetical protein